MPYRAAKTPARPSCPAASSSGRALICISLAVFLVSVIFGLANMEIRCQKIQAIEEYGNWHVSVRNLPPQDASLIAARPKVSAMSWYNVLNYRLDEGYALNGKQAASAALTSPYSAIS